MSVISISDLSRQHMLNILGYGSGSQLSKTAGSNSASGGAQGSSFAQVLSQLQNLEQTNPTQYSQVSQQISTNLSQAAANAQTQGNSSFASQLTTLSKDFATASQSGQLPDVADLANVMSGAHNAKQTAAAAGQAPQHGFLHAIGQVLGLARV